MLIIAVLLLSAIVSYPGFPLTEVPDEYRALIWQVKRGRNVGETLVKRTHGERVPLRVLPSPAPPAVLVF